MPHNEHPRLSIPEDQHSDLETVLSAWHEATQRLEHTHEALRSEVQRLTDELETKNRELARKNRLADLGQMASHIAHELRNNLVPVTLYLSLLRRRASEDPQTVSIVDKISAACTALDVTVNDLLHFTADRDPNRERIHLAQLIDDVIVSLRPQLMAQAVAVDIDVPGSLVVDADRDMLRRSVLNLTLNAVDAMPEGGELVVTGIDCHENIEIEIADSGEGLGEDVRARIFEPFFTTKHTGTGLGLAIVERIAEVHGGSVMAMNCPEGGAAFTIVLPKRMAMQAAA